MDENGVPAGKPGDMTTEASGALEKLVLKRGTTVIGANFLRAYKAFLLHSYHKPYVPGAVTKKPAACRKVKVRIVVTLEDGREAIMYVGAAAAAPPSVRAGRACLAR